MCGIFAYCNYGTPTQQKVVVEKLLNGLRRLEYRGYDSAGIAIDNGPNISQLEPLVMKETGKIDKLAELVADKENLNPEMYFENHCGIGHTRWATHGPPRPRTPTPTPPTAPTSFSSSTTASSPTIRRSRRCCSVRVSSSSPTRTRR